MKEPKFCSNKTQSYLQFETTVGWIRWGIEAPYQQIFVETKNGKVYLTDINGYQCNDVINDISGNGINIDGSILKDGTLSANVSLITTPVSTVSIKEYGDGRNFTTVLTLTEFIIGALAGAAAALGIGNIVAAFPAGVHIEQITYLSLSLKCAGTAVNTDTGLGSVIATGVVSVLSGTTTFEDRHTGQTIATAFGGGTVVASLKNTTAGVQTGIALNDVSSIKNIFLNSAGTWNANNINNLTANGTIVIKWTKMN
jgi:hypothetical protein